MIQNSVHNFKPCASDGCIVRGDKYRFTVITSRLIRMEYSDDGVFEDNATQTVFVRKFEDVSFKVIDKGNRLEIITDYLHLYYNKSGFSSEGLYIKLKGMSTHKCAAWHFGLTVNPWQKMMFNTVNDNVYGTINTLDGKDGRVDLEDGILTKTGFYVLDDSNSLAFDENLNLIPRKKESDFYFFGYQEDYRSCIRDFTKLAGGIPMIPRYALGNWWSRFYKYDEKSYKELIGKFKKENIPLSVAVLDNDWHTVNPQDNNAWTGYSWNKDLFPNPKAFAKWIHRQNLKLSVNLHPVLGISKYEDHFNDLCKKLGEDGKTDNVMFRADDPEFMKAYFETIIHPLEKEGVDSWWIDWQQKDKFKSEFDTQFVLNHSFYYDALNRDKFPVIMSRYAGLGSLRYPLGFSGDVVMSWESLKFQPYFTATASNVGYTWWSHDIGGHARGIWNLELLVRWIQFGVFSPVMRLHSGNNPLMIKEPWSLPDYERKIVGKFMRLRHKLIPYLYTMNYRCNTQGRMLIEPMYYEIPSLIKSQEFENQYFFGSSLMVCPITSPADSITAMGKVKAYIPRGTWFDFFTHRKYESDGQAMLLYRNLEQYPVFAKAGSIIPMASDEDIDKNGTDEPKILQVDVFCGACGSFTMYEDSGKTLFDYTEKGNIKLSVKGQAGRNYIFNFIGLKLSGTEFDEENCCSVVTVKQAKQSFELAFSKNQVQVVENDTVKWGTDILRRTQTFNEIRERLYSIICSNDKPEVKISKIVACECGNEILDALIEVLSASSK